ncbi:glycosyltransferase [Rhodobacteraceae bacterium IMCC1335]
MKILLVSDSYPPEIRSASKLVYDLRTHLVDLGFETDVITTEAKYNIDKKSVFKDDAGVSEPVRIKVLEHHNVPYVIRGISQLLMPYYFYKGFKKHLNRNYDLVIIYSPPLTLGLFGAYLKRRFAKTTVLNVQDLFPQNAIDLGILKNFLLIKFFRYIERFCYKHNDLVTFHSQSNLELANKEFMNELSGKSIIMHNWQKFENTSYKDEAYVRKKYGIAGDKKIAIFAGVLGPAQGLNNLIELANTIQVDAPEWHFLVLGDGAERKKIQSLAEAYKLSNIQFEDFVSPDEYQKVLSGCQLGTVFLSELNKTPVVPGKILGYMEKKVPVFCVLNRESDAHELVASAECGATTVAGIGAKEIGRSFLDFVSNYEMFKAMGQSGYTYARENFVIDVVVNGLLEEINKRVP